MILLFSWKIYLLESAYTGLGLITFSTDVPIQISFANLCLIHLMKY